MSLADLPESLRDFTGTCPHCLQPCTEELREHTNAFRHRTMRILVLTCSLCEIGSRIPLVADIDETKARCLASLSMRRQTPKGR